MAIIHCTRTELAEAISAVDLPADAVVWVSNPEIQDDWDTILSELTDAFEFAQRAAKSQGPLVLVIDGDDLLGRNGPGRAMVACGVLSGARTAAVEISRSGIPVNVIALESVTTPESAARWVETLARPGGPTGELIRLGSDHIGKSLP